MNYFKEAFSRTMKHEGKYNFDGLDKGGETFMGISRVYWPSWPGWQLVDREWENPLGLIDRSALLDLVESFYKTNFWLRIQGDRVAAVSPEVACELFDTAVNLDVPDAVRFLQTALNMQRITTRAFPELTVDGLLGSKTLMVIERYLATQPGNSESNEEILLNCMNGEQYICYKGNPRHPYFRGWFLRV